MVFLIAVHDSLGIRLRVLPGFISIVCPAIQDLLASKTAAHCSVFSRGVRCNRENGKCYVEQHDGASSIDRLLPCVLMWLSRLDFYFMRCLNASVNTIEISMNVGAF